MSIDRRRYFRIEDWVYLEARRLEPAELNLAIEKFHSGHRHSAESVRGMADLERQLDDFSVIRLKIPEVARQLENLQTQIDQLRQALIPGEEESQHAALDEPRKVNISAQGISFTTDELFKPVDTVELSLKLTPSSQWIPIIATVVVVDDNEDNENEGELGFYRVSLDFQHIHELDREIMIKHIHDRQIETLGTGRTRSF